MLRASDTKEIIKLREGVEKESFRAGYTKGEEKKLWSERYCNYIAGYLALKVKENDPNLGK